jgi:hypothetical protein
VASTKQKQYPKTSTVTVERTGVIVLERFTLSFDLSERDIQRMKEKPQGTVAGILRRAGLKVDRVITGTITNPKKPRVWVHYAFPPEHASTWMLEGRL